MRNLMIGLFIKTQKKINKMIINTKNIKYYFLTTQSDSVRANYTRQLLKDYDLEEVNPYELGVSVAKSGSIGHARMIEKGVRNQSRERRFEPFVILEDDIEFYRDMPQEIDIPDDADLLYIGVSALGMIDGNFAQAIIANEIDENTLRVFNMLSGHAIVVCSMVGALLYQKCMVDSYHKERMWDAYVAESQPWHNIYCLKSPIFYQASERGGKQVCTKTSINSFASPNMLRDDYMNDFKSDATYKIIEKSVCDLSFLSKLKPIPKKVHMSWRNKEFIHSQNPLVLNGVRNLIDINPDWEVEVSIDVEDVEQYLSDNLEKKDYDLLRSRPIVEKVDVWRLLKVFLEGGMYMDIDRHCNKELNSLIGKDVKQILPFHKPKNTIIDCSQDIILSSAENPIIGYALDLNLRRRRSGWVDIMTLGPINYFHAVTKFIHGYSVNRYPPKEIIDQILLNIENSIYIDYFIEKPPFETLIFKYDESKFKAGNGEGKEGLYKESNVPHWSIDNPVIRANRRFD